ncbi:MAG: HAMP domain-containing sensor histidine kinase [Actinomycetota bacterium]|nr:HAMP domain-containing sensor histidine kinase [Actinomycetota bacterium]
MSLFWRVLLTNVLVLVLARASHLGVRTVTSSPVALSEALFLGGGLIVAIVLNLVLVRRAFSPLVRLRQAVRGIDPREPGRRVPAFGDDAEVVELTHAFNEMLDRLEAERRESVRRILRAQEDERRRIALELHDEVGQQLTALVLHLERASRASDGRSAELIEARETARESLNDVRLIAQRLRPEALDELGLASALAALSERLSTLGDIRVESQLEPDLPPLTDETELVIYRVAQEGLTNAFRHAAPSRVELTLACSHDGIVLGVTDDGCGLAGAPAGLGLQGMRERARFVGGDLGVKTRPEGGTELRLEVPAGSLSS